MERRRAPVCPALPNEIVEGVLLLLDEADLRRFSMVSKFWNRYLMSDSFWEKYEAYWHKASPSSSLSSSSCYDIHHRDDCHDIDDGFNDGDDDEDDGDDDDSVDEYLHRIEYGTDDEIDEYLDRIEDAFYDYDIHGISSDDNYEDEDEDEDDDHDDGDDDRVYSYEDIEKMERKVRQIKRKIHEMEEAEVVTSRMTRKIEKLKVGMRRMKKKIRRSEEEDEVAQAPTIIYGIVEPWVYDPSDYESGVIWI